MTSEAFHLLSRGGVSFDKSKSKYASEAHLFNVGLGFFFHAVHFAYMCQKRNLTGGKNTAFLNPQSGELPPELNFFKDAQTNLGKRKVSNTTYHREGKRKKTGSEDLLKNQEDEDEEPRFNSALTTHRVAVRGTNIPQHLDSFEALKETYELPSHLFSNLCSNGYNKPTSIQAYCAPILLSVSLMVYSGITAHNLKGRDLVAISPTGTGKTLSYLLPIFSKLLAPSSSGNVEFGLGTRALVVVPTRELAHQIHNECLKLAQGRKWKLVLLSKATANSLSDKTVRNKIGA